MTGTTFAETIAVVEFILFLSREFQKLIFVSFKVNFFDAEIIQVIVKKKQSHLCVESI
jgi:hypothetical protein